MQEVLHLAMAEEHRRGSYFTHILRCRPDVCLAEELDTSELDMNAINIWDAHSEKHPRKVLNDTLAFGPRFYMASYLRLFEWVFLEGERALTPDGRWIGDTFANGRPRHPHAYNPEGILTHYLREVVHAPIVTHFKRRINITR